MKPSHSTKAHLNVLPTSPQQQTLASYNNPFTPANEFQAKFEPKLNPAKVKAKFISAKCATPTNHPPRKLNPATARSFSRDTFLHQTSFKPNAGATGIEMANSFRPMPGDCPVKQSKNPRLLPFKKERGKKKNKGLVHHTAFAPNIFSSDTFYSKKIVHQTTLTLDIFYAKHLLNQTTLDHTTFTPGTLYTNQLLHQSAFTQINFYTKQIFDTEQLSPPTPLTPTTFYTK